MLQTGAIAALAAAIAVGAAWPWFGRTRAQAGGPRRLRFRPTTSTATRPSRSTNCKRAATPAIRLRAVCSAPNTCSAFARRGDLNDVDARARRCERLAASPTSRQCRGARRYRLERPCLSSLSGRRCAPNVRPSMRCRSTTAPARRRPRFSWSSAAIPRQNRFSIARGSTIRIQPGSPFERATTS